MRWQLAIPQFEFGCLSNMEALERCEQLFPGLHFCGSIQEKHLGPGLRKKFL
jgi:hypothetical protein